MYLYPVTVPPIQHILTHRVLHHKSFPSLGHNSVHPFPHFLCGLHFELGGVLDTPLDLFDVFMHVLLA